MRLKACTLIFSTSPEADRFLSLGTGRPRFLTHFAGRFSYADFFLSSAFHAGADLHLVVTQRHAEQAHDYMERAWGEGRYWRILPFLGEDDTSPLQRRMVTALKNELKAWVYFVKADYPCYFDLRQVLRDTKRRAKVFQPVLGGKACPCLFVEKGLLVDVLEELVAKRVPVNQALEKAFNLLARYPKIAPAEVQGYLHPCATLDAYIQANLDILAQREWFEGFYRLVPLQSGVGERKQALIDEHAEFHESMISDGCVVSGRIENSILFPNVVVGKGAQVINSVLMPGTVVGDGSRLVNCLVDGVDEHPDEERASIGDGVQIGNRRSAVRQNSEYGTALKSGFTFISHNASIPRGVQIGANCYIGPGVTRQDFRRVRSLADGRSLLAQPATRVAPKAVPR